MFSRKSLYTLLFSGLALSMTACSGSSWIQGASLSTSNQDGSEYVQLATQLNTGSISLVSVALPIPNPHNLSQVIGQVEIKNGLSGGGSELDVTLNLSSVLSLPDDPTGGTLPNGTAIPVSGVNPQNWIVLPVANGKTKVYLNLDQQNKKAALGVAVSISQLSIGMAGNLLLPFSFKNISGVAGVYTGPTAGQSGFAVFADASSLLSGSAASVLFVQKKSADVIIQQKLYQLNNSRSRLHIQ